MSVLQKVLDIASGGALSRAIEKGAREIWGGAEGKGKKPGQHHD